MSRHKTQGQGKEESHNVRLFVATICNCHVSNTSFSLIRIGLDEGSKTEIKVTLVGFDHDLSIIIVASSTSIDLCDGDLIAHMNNT